MKILKYDEWKDTALTLHQIAQMMGKVKLARMRPQPEWNHALLEVTAEGFSTGLIPNESKSFSIDINIRENKIRAVSIDGSSSSFSLEKDTSISEYFIKFKAMLSDIMCETEIYTVPQEMSVLTPFEKNHDKLDYNADSALNFFYMCAYAYSEILKFIAPLRTKKTMPSFFWGTFDISSAVFSGKDKPFPYEGYIEKAAFDEEMIEFGFWPGDTEINDPSFFILPYPFLGENMENAPIKPDKAFYGKEKSEFFLKLEDLMSYKNPEKELQDFFISGFEIITKDAQWENLDWFKKPLLIKR